MNAVAITVAAIYVLGIVPMTHLFSRWLGCAALGAIMALFWPITLPIFWLFWLAIIGLFFLIGMARWGETDGRRS
jgi:chromate transport protein ChrA